MVDEGEKPRSPIFRDIGICRSEKGPIAAHHEEELKKNETKFIDKYGTHIIVGVKMGGKDVVYVKQQYSSPTHVQKRLKDVADKRFSDVSGQSSVHPEKAYGREMKETNERYIAFLDPSSPSFHSNQEEITFFWRRRGGSSYKNMPHNKWCQTVQLEPEVISISFIPIASLLNGIDGSGFLGHAINRYLRYKPPIEELYQFLEFQLPRQWAPVFGDVPLGPDRKQHGVASLQFSLMGPKLYVNTDECDARHDDRISELPDEIKVVILSSLQLREAAATSVLSSQWSNLWKNTSTLEFDRISKLPDQIIVLILSFLPLRDAARTSVLSSRWPHLWKRTPNLNFKLDTFARGGSNLNRIRCSWDLDEWDLVKCKYVQLVNSVLQSHKAPSLKQFSISFHVDKSAQLYVTKWLEFVFSRQVERLELNFQGVQQEFMVELEAMLRESRICTADVILSKSLKSLRLKTVKVSGEAIEWILRGCPLLEELIIRKVFLTSDVEVCDANLMLKHLEIYFLTGDKSIKISTPNLTQLTVGDTSGKLVLENVSKLVRTHFIYASGRPDNVQTFTWGLFSFISFQLTILTLSLHWSKMVLANEFPEMPNLKKLFLVYCDIIPTDFLPLTALIWASPRLEEFKLEFRAIFSEQHASKKGKPNLERSPHQQLKVFELAELVDGDGENVKELVTYIVNNCIALEKIIFRACSWFHYCEKFHDITDRFKAEDYAMQVRDHAKQQLQDELPQHIQLEFL